MSSLLYYALLCSSVHLCCAPECCAWHALHCFIQHCYQYNNVILLNITVQFAYRIRFAQFYAYPLHLHKHSNELWLTLSDSEAILQKDKGKLDGANKRRRKKTDRERDNIVCMCVVKARRNACDCIIILCITS